MRSLALVLCFVALASALRVQVEKPKKKRGKAAKAAGAEEGQVNATTRRVPLPGEEVAYVNFIRHAEDCDVGPKALSPIGHKRAQYLARCMSKPQPSMTMPFGAPTALFAARVGTNKKNKTMRPIITAEPLANVTGLRLQAPCVRDEETEDKLDTYDVFAKCQRGHIMRELKDKATINVFMTKHEMPNLLKALSPSLLKNRAFKKYPEDGAGCMSKTQQWKGEYCKTKDPDAKPPCSKPKGYGCSEAIWQVQFARNGTDGPWAAVDVFKVFQDFQGQSADQECTGDLAPIQGGQLYQLRRERKEELEAERLSLGEEESLEDEEETSLWREALDTNSSDAFGSDELGLKEKKCFNCPCPSLKSKKDLGGGAWWR